MTHLAHTRDHSISILAHCLATADRAQFYLHCCQSRSVPESLPTSFPPPTCWKPCGRSAWQRCAIYTERWIWSGYNALPPVVPRGDRGLDTSNINSRSLERRGAVANHTAFLFPRYASFSTFHFTGGRYMFEEFRLRQSFLSTHRIPAVPEIVLHWKRKNFPINSCYLLII